MKKVFALILVLLVISAIVVPFMALGEAIAVPSEDVQPTAELAPAEPATIMPEAEANQETDPGGIDVTELVQALIGVLSLVITRYLVPWLRAHISAQNLARIKYFHDVAVLAAEKAYGAGHGPEKLADATAYLKSKGIIVDEKIIDSLIQQFFGKKTDATTSA